MSSAAGEESTSDERRLGADLWEAAADERERLADERERLADERDQLADVRETLADRHDHALDRRAAVRADADLVDRAEAMARLVRAREALQRAQANVLRAQRAATRADARVAMRIATEQRQAAAGTVTGEEELAWQIDRRDFVAVERELLAEGRDGEADRRDETADQRDRLADIRERDALDREWLLDHTRSGSPPHAERRTSDVRKRAVAAAARRTSAAERASAAKRWGPRPYGPTLLASFSELTREVFGSDNLSVLLPRALKFVVAAVPGCDWAGVAMWRDGRMVEAIGSDAVAGELDRAAAAGPGAEALRQDHTIHVPRIGDPPRWPPFEAVAARHGVASALCHGMFAHGTRWSPLGVLSLYGAAPDAFTSEDEEFTLIVAAFLSAAVALARRKDHVERREAALHRALSSRDVIGQAKGILMERQRLSAGDAFDLLRRVSQRMNRKLTEVAEHLAETGELPG